MSRGIIAGFLLGGGFLVAILLANRQPVLHVRLSSSEGPVVFREACAPCHGPRGEGQRGFTPPLRGRSLPAGEVRGIVRKGRNRMPAQPDLGDEAAENVARFVSGWR